MLRSLSFLLLFCSGILAQSPNYLIGTIAGSGRPTGDNGAATSALLTNPAGIVFDSAGNLYIADQDAHRIRKVTPDGRITTIAGTGVRGYTGDGGQATAATLFSPAGIAVDGSGNIYFSDIDENVVRKISPAGFIFTVAGTGQASYSGDNMPATSSALNYPAGIAVDSVGNLYIADTYNNRVRKVSPLGVITTVAGTGRNAGSIAGGPGISTPVGQPDCVTVDAQGNLYVCEYSFDRVLKLDASGRLTPFAGNGSYSDTGDGGPATSASLKSPRAVAVDLSGNVFVAEEDGYRVRRISSGIIATVAGVGSPGFSGDGMSPSLAQFLNPSGLAFDPTGRLYISDSDNNRVRRLDFSAAQTSTVVGSAGMLGDGGAATAAQLFNPAGLATDSTGNIYVADTANHRIRKITPAGVISTVAGNGTPGLSGDGGPATAAQLFFPEAIVLDSAGNLVVSDYANSRLRRVGKDGVIQTLAQSLNGPSALAADGLGNVYVAVSQDNKVIRVTAGGGTTLFAGSATPDTLNDGSQAVMAGLSLPSGLAIDAAGDVFIADTGHERIRKVTPTGIISTIAGNGVVGYGGDGGPATAAMLALPEHLAIDSAGNLFVNDLLNARVRRIGTDGTITTIAGNGGFGFDGDGGQASRAQVGFLNGLAIDSAGTLYVSDYDSHRIRKIYVAAAPADFTFSAMVGANGITLTLTSTNGFVGTVLLGIKGGNASIPAATLAAGQTVSVLAPSGLTPPGVSTQIVFTADSGTLHKESTVTYTAPTAAPVISASGIVNAASFATGAVAPGEIITIYGSSLGPASLTTLVLDAAGKVATTLSGVTVTFDGKPAPLLYVSSAQISAIVPYGLMRTAQMQVSYNGRASNSVAVMVTDASPALFTTNSSGSGAAAVLNQDGSVNSASNPAEKGSMVVLFGTGEGETSPTGTDGVLAASVFPAPILPVSVSIDGQDAAVLYAGAAPGLVAGLFQINAMVPASAGSGPVKIIVTVGTRSSPVNTVTIYVR